MPRPHDEIFAALMAPFGRDEIRTRPQGGRQIEYVTARMVMNRLDDILGPANWWDDYSPTTHGAICRLTIRLPDGSELTKTDAGGNAGMADEGDDDKSGFSDAFKRAAVKFGVGRHLYRDGMPTFAREILGLGPKARQEGNGVGPPTPADHPHARQPESSATPPAESPGRELYKWAMDHGRLEEMNAWAKKQVPKFPFKMIEWTQDQVEAAWLQFGGTAK